MITTVTVNPSIDKLYSVEQLTPGTVMRVKAVHNTAGGKGINVARAVALAGEQVRAVGFCGGFNGQYLTDMLSGQNVLPAFTPVAGETRSCINIREKSGTHTEFLEPGPAVTGQNVADFLAQFRAITNDSRVITISGSMPAGCPQDLYQQLIGEAGRHSIPVILDTSGKLLKHGVAASQKPALIKPNQEELGQLTGTSIRSLEEAVTAATDLHRRQGIAYVAVSLGKEGSILVCREGVLRALSPDVPVKNTVGCGDCMVAGFAVGLVRGYGPEELLRFATAVSAANAMTEATGTYDPATLPELIRRTVIERLK